MAQRDILPLLQLPKDRRRAGEGYKAEAKRSREKGGDEEIVGLREKKESGRKNGEVGDCVFVWQSHRPLRLCVDEDGRTAGMSWAKANSVSISGSANKHQ